MQKNLLKILYLTLLEGISCSANNCLSLSGSPNNILRRSLGNLFTNLRNCVVNSSILDSFVVFIIVIIKSIWNGNVLKKIGFAAFINKIPAIQPKKKVICDTFIH